MNGRWYDKIRRIFDRTLEEPLLVSFIVLLAVAALVVGVSWPYYFSDAHDLMINLLAEAHGMIFDILVISILIFWLNQVGQRKQRIRAYIDEIDDFRMWESEEAAFRTVGNIKRLNRHRIYDIDLVNCFLARTNLNHVILKGANMNNANISNSNLIHTDLRRARLNRTNFENSNLNQVILEGSYASGANFRDANMIKSNLHNAFLIKADFSNAFLMEADLRGANLTGATLDMANLYKVDFRGAVGLVAEQFENVKTIYLARFEPSLGEQLKNNYPELLKK